MISYQIRNRVLDGSLCEGFLQHVLHPGKAIQNLSVVQDLKNLPSAKQGVKNARLAQIIHTATTQFPTLADAGVALQTGLNPTKVAITLEKHPGQVYKDISGRFLKRGLQTAAVVAGVGTALHVYKRLRKRMQKAEPQYRNYAVYPQYGYTAVGQEKEIHPEYQDTGT